MGSLTLSSIFNLFRLHTPRLGKFCSTYRDAYNMFFSFCISCTTSYCCLDTILLTNEAKQTWIKIECFHSLIIIMIMIIFIITFSILVSITITTIIKPFLPRMHFETPWVAKHSAQGFLLWFVTKINRINQWLIRQSCCLHGYSKAVVSNPTWFSNFLTDSWTASVSHTTLLDKECTKSFVPPWATIFTLTNWLKLRWTNQE